MSDYERIGYCQRCGRCCEGKPLWDSFQDDSNIDQHFKDILKSISKTFEADLKKMNCPYKVMRGHLAVCTQYKDRPQFCKDHPALPADRIEGCGYKFVEKEE